MKILLIALGSAGDVHPFVGLGAALVERGHQVSLATNTFFEPLVRRAGLEFLTADTEEASRWVMENPDVWHPRKGVFLLAEHLFLRLVEPVYELVRQVYEPGMVVAAPCSAVGARIAQEKLGVPLATVHLQPMMLRSVFRSPALPPMMMADWVPRAAKRLQFRLADALLDHLLAPRVNAFRARLGLGRVRRIASWWNSPQRIIGLFPDWFAPVQPDWPPQTVLTGFPLWDERSVTEISPEVEAFLAAGEPPIVFTPGSAMLHGGEFFRAAVEACGLLKRRAILLTRYPEQLPAALPAEVRHFDFVPLSRLLPRSAALVCHGGIGTTAQGLAAGIPQLVMPMAFDQPDNAARVRSLGVGTSLARKKFTGPAIARRLGELLANEQVLRNCQAVAAKFHTERSLVESCEAIESLAGVVSCPLSVVSSRSGCNPKSKIENPKY